MTRTTRVSTRPSGKVASIASRKGLWAVDAGDQDVVDAAGIES